ncbi:MAG: calcium-binding protein [Bryobacteraceae bacterium]
MPLKSGHSTALASANPRSPADCGSAAHRSAESWEQPHEKTQERPVREDRIHNEAIVDAYTPEEQAMGWYYYLENQLRFPFQAKCTVAKVVSPLRKGETVEVLRMAPEDACSADMLVQIRWQGRKMAVPLSQLAVIASDESTEEAIADWHYWVAQSYLF